MQGSHMGNVWHRSHAVFCVRHQPRSYRRLLRTFWWTKQNVLFGMLSDLKRERLGARVYQELRKLSSCRGIDQSNHLQNRQVGDVAEDRQCARIRNSEGMPRWCKAAGVPAEKEMLLNVIPWVSKIVRR